jgi:hypothetical protein
MIGKTCRCLTVVEHAGSIQKQHSSTALRTCVLRLQPSPGGRRLGLASLAHAILRLPTRW